MKNKKFLTESDIYNNSYNFSNINSEQNNKIKKTFI